MLKIQEVTHLQEFNINFGRLKLGKHEFSFDIDDTFFANYSQELISQCQTKTDLVIDKTRANLMNFHFNISGHGIFPCDRCLEDMSYPLEGKFSVLVKLEDSDNDSDEIVYLPVDAYEYNVADLIYDFHILSIPFKKECVRDNHPTCIKIEQLIEEGSSDDDTDGDDQDADPRWNELRKLL